MAQTNVELASAPGGKVITYPFGQAETSIRRAEVVGELRSRNYLGCETRATLGSLGQTYTTTSRTMAITRAVDDALTRHSRGKICTTAAGCYLSDAIWNSIVSLAVLLANRYYQQTTASPVYSPTPTYSPRPTYSPTYSPTIAYSPRPTYSPTAYSPTVRSPTPYTTYIYGGASPVPGVPWVTETLSPSALSPVSPSVSPSWQSLSAQFSTYFRGVPDLGQIPIPATQFPATWPTTDTGWTSTEKWAFALDLVSKGLAWATSYLQAKAERDRLLAMGVSIPQMTAQEVNNLLAQYKLMNPGVSDAQLKNVGAGLLGQPQPGAIPQWVWPLAAGLAVFGVLAFMKGRRR